MVKKSFQKVQSGSREKSNTPLMFLLWEVSWRGKSQWGWLRESNKKVLDEDIFLKAPTTTSSKTVVCLCGRRWWNGPLGEVTLALFTLAGPFKDTRRRQCRQLYLGLHGDGVLLTGNFPDSLPDEEVAFYLTASLYLLPFHSWIRKNTRKREKWNEKVGAKKKINETASHRRTRGKDCEWEMRI